MPLHLADPLILVFNVQENLRLFSSAHEVYRFRRALPCFYPGKVTIIRSKRGGMFKMLL